MTFPSASRYSTVPRFSCFKSAIDLLAIVHSNDDTPVGHELLARCGLHGCRVDDAES